MQVGEEELTEYSSGHGCNTHVIQKPILESKVMAIALKLNACWTRRSLYLMKSHFLVETSFIKVNSVVAPCIFSALFFHVFLVSKSSVLLMLKSNLYYTRGIALKRVTRGCAYLRGLAPGQHSSEETSQR